MKNKIKYITSNSTWDSFTNCIIYYNSIFFTGYYRERYIIGNRYGINLKKKFIN